MCGDNEIDIEEFVKKHKEEIEKILKEQEEGGGIKIDIGPLDKMGDAVKGMMSMFFDPKIQMHFIRAGKEFFSGIEEMMKNAPFPDEMKEKVNKAYEMKDRMKDIMNDPEPESKPKGKDKEKEKKMKKIDVE